MAMFGVNPVDEINLRGPILEALQRRGQRIDAAGAGLQDHSVYGEPLAASGKKKNKKQKKTKKAVKAELKELDVKEGEGKKKKGRPKRKAGAKKQPTAWNKHVSEFKKKHPDMSFKKVLKEAAKTYKK
jgi:hypothetical protein